MVQLLFCLALDTVMGALVTSAVVVASETVRNGWLNQGLVHLPLYVLSDRFVALLVPALCLSAVSTAAVALVARLRRRGIAASVGAGIVLAAGALLVDRHASTLVSLVLDRVPARLGAALAREQLRWTTQEHWVLVLLCALLLAFAVARRLASEPASRARLWPRRLAATCAIVAVAVPVLSWTNRAFADRGAPRRNVVLIVLDTFAAQHMAAFGYQRNTTPELDALARRGTSFTRAYSMAPWTLPSHASLFTGLPPVRHRATQESLGLDSKFVTLAEILRNAGYRTFAAVGNPIVGRPTGLDQGFAEFLPTWRHDVIAAYRSPTQHANNAALLHFLDVGGARARFFAFLNYNDAHGPYRPPERYASMYLPQGSTTAQARAVDQSWQRYYAGINRLSDGQFALLNALYDADLSYVSRVVAELVTGLEQRGLMDSTLVIITADHGENVGDHGHLDHVFNLYDTLLHVPLIVLDPGGAAAAQDRRLVDNADVFRTILGAARCARDAAGGTGRDLLDPQAAAAWKVSDHVSEYYFPNQALATFDPPLLRAAAERLRPFLRRIRALRSGDWKLIWGSDGRHELYNLGEDPGERHDLARAEPDRVRAMTAQLASQLAAAAGGYFALQDEPAPGAISGFGDLDDETLERLRSLGYAR